MRAKLCPIILASFACAQLGTAVAWSARRPTHSVARDNRRLVLPTPSHEAPHTRAGHQPPQRGPAHGHASTHATRRKEALKAPHADADAHHGRRTTRAVSAARRTTAANADPADTSAALDRATVDRVHAWEQSQHHTTPAPLPSGSPVEQALEAAGAEIAATEITPGEALSTTLPSSGRVELPRIPTVEQEAATPVLLPSIYDKRGHLVVPAPLYGSHEVLLHQNQMADHDGLTRVRDDDDLIDLRRQKKLVPLPESEFLRVDERLPSNRRFTRPWTAVFLAVLSRDFYTSFHESLQVNSAVRTVQIQQRLLRINGNAAPTAGDTASPHLTGQAVDIGKRSLTMPQIAWMRAYLQPLIEQGKIDVEEEFQQSCFHISVYRSYTIPTRESLASAAAGRSTQSY